MRYPKALALILTLVLALSFGACSSEPAPVVTPAPVTTPTAAPAPTPEATAEPTPEPTPAVDSSLPVKIMALNGTTGFGMAKLINDAAEGKSALNYDIAVETDAANINAALIAGKVDIAALPTNAAAVVYQKSQGAVQLLALNTKGVLYLLVNGENSDISSMEQLRGKTVYAPAQNPSFIFAYLCAQSGLEVGKDVIIDTSYAQPADLRTAVAAGEVDIAVLPEPMVTIACSANDKLSVALDLTQVWDSVATPGSLVQGCVVVRREFAEAHPAEVAAFLTEYEASIDFLSADPAAAGAAIEASGVFANGKVAQKALPKCNVCFIAGEDMRSAMAEFLDIMFAVAPQSVGGALPADDFYYIP